MPCHHTQTHAHVQVLEGLVYTKPALTAPSPPSGGAHPSTPSPSPSPAPTKLSGLLGAVALALAQGLLPSPDPAAKPATPSSATSASLAAAATAHALLLHAAAPEVGPSFMPAPPAATTTPAPAAPRPVPTAAASSGPGTPQHADADGGGSFGGGAVAVAAAVPLAGAALARKVMSLLMVVLSEGDVEVQCGVVGVLLDVLLRYRASVGGDDAKLVEQVRSATGPLPSLAPRHHALVQRPQHRSTVRPTGKRGANSWTEFSVPIGPAQVCVVYDGLLASGSPALVSSVLGAAQQLAVATAPTAARSAAAAQLLEWVLQAVLVLAGQLAAPAHQTPGAAPSGYPTDYQRQQAVQLLSVAHAAFMQDVRLPRLHSVLQVR